MSFEKCLDQNLSERTKKAAIERYNRLKDEYTKRFGSAKAERMAQRETLAHIDAALTKKKAEVAHALAQARVKDGLEARIAAKAEEGIKTTYDAEIRSFLKRVFDRTQTVARGYFREMNDTIQRLGVRMAGFSQDADMTEKVVLEAMGAATGDKEAAVLGRQVAETLERVHDEYTKAGGMLGKLSNYFPQRHNRNRISAVSKEEWKSFVVPILDRERMIDHATGLPLPDKALNKMLDKAYQNIITDGLDQIETIAKDGGQVPGLGGDLYRRRDASRFLHFASPQDFLAYNQRFGFGKEGLYENLVNHISVMSRDTAVMQMMGPKPNAIMRNLSLEMEARQTGINKKRWTEGMYRVLVGTGRQGEPSLFYKAVVGVQDLLRASLLGGAAVSALTDSFYSALAAKQAGIGFSRGMKAWVKGMRGGYSRQMAARQGFIAESLLGNSYASTRYADDASGIPKMRFMSSSVQRLSGLQYMTEGAKMGVPLEMMAFVTEYQQKSWLNLPKDFRAALKEYGFTGDDWAIIQKAVPENFDEFGNVTFITRETIAAVDDPKAKGVALKYGDYLTALGMKAANEPTLETRAITTGNFLGDAQVGTGLRLVASSAFMFKSFLITNMFNFVIPAIVGARRGNFGDLATLAIGMTLAGAAVVQIKQALAGREPADMDKPAFWKMAALQGGGMGIFGDFFLADTNRFGQDFVTTMAGPMAGFLNDAVKLTQGNLAQFVTEDDANFGRDMIDFVARYTPIDSLWYTRLVVERMLLDQVRKMADPSFEQRMLKLRRRYKEELGQDYYWRHGEMLPNN